MLSILKDVNQIKGVKGSSVVDPDGNEIVSHFLFPIAPERVKALVVSARRVADEIADRAHAGTLVQVILEASEGKFFVQAVELGFLVVLADSQANVGLIRVELAQTGPLIN